MFFDTKQVRLSSWVYLIALSDGNTELVHAITQRRMRIPQNKLGELLECRRFTTMRPELSPYAENGFLVLAGEDPVRADAFACISADSEAAAIVAWERAYWSEEIETNREYRWRGTPIVKMPDDLFFYQELISDNPIYSVLEIGCEPGGSAVFFNEMLSHKTGIHDQMYVGVDLDIITQHDDDRIRKISGDADSKEVFAEVKKARAEYGLVIIDAGTTFDKRMALFERYAPLVAPDGIIVFEDLSMPSFPANYASLALDDFLLRRNNFGVYERARRFLTGKSTRGAFKRYA